MRLFIDTQSGLTTVDERTDFNRLDAVVIGQGVVPDYVGNSDASHIWTNVTLLERLLALQSDTERSAFRGMLDFARSREWLQTTEVGDQVRVHIAERIAA